MIEGGENVTEAFYWLSVAGMVVLITSAFLYHISISYQSKAPDVIANVSTLVWFIAL